VARGLISPVPPLAPTWQVSEKLGITARGLPPRLVADREPAELGPQHHRLQGVEPEIESDSEVLVPALRSVVAEQVPG
jgi:hypothetical protein